MDSMEWIPYSECQWLQNRGQSDEIVISSRIRLARNVKGIPFSQWASSGNMRQVVERVKNVLPLCPGTRDMKIVELDRVDPLDREFLLERHLISREMAEGSGFRMVAISPDETLSIMINEEDHLRIQCLRAGAGAEGNLAADERTGRSTLEHLEFAYSERWGYLTACPTNVGTGIRCSVMIHLPALVMAKQVDRVLGAVNQLGLTVRGIQGEGTEIAGNIAQLSNQVTLGVTEEESIEKIGKMAHRIIASELEAQRQLMSEARDVVEDKVFRAYGILRGARMITTRETAELVSALRFGRTSGFCPKSPIGR
jgi:protein arginine kinase